MLFHSVKFYKRAGAAICCLVLALATFPAPAGGLANLSSDLFNASLILNKVADFPSGQTGAQTQYGNRDCQDRKVIIRPATPLQAEVSNIECVVDTAYGSVSPNGYIQRPGTSTWGKLLLTSGAPSLVIPIQHSNTAIRFTSGPANSMYLNFTSNFDEGIRSSTDALGQVTHVVPDQPTARLTDASGQNLPVILDSISFSSNGRWMMADVRAVGAVRVDLQTWQVLPFADSFNYDTGVSPSVQTAITSDGRYAVVASSTFNRFSVYDLETCGAVPPRITQKVSCNSRDVFSNLLQPYPSLVGYSNIRFVAENLLVFFMRYKNSSGAQTVAKFSLGPPGADAPKLAYLALGDSHTSGEGAYQYKPYTDIAPNLCHLSVRSYPYLLGQSSTLNSFESVACSGARLKDIVSRDVEYHLRDQSKLGSGFDNEIFGTYLVGYRPQGLFVERFRPAALTISVVGNDTGLPAHIKQCLLPGNCFPGYEDRVELFREINDQFDALVSTYLQIKADAAPKTNVYAIGYGELFYPYGKCALNVHLGIDEMVLANQLIDQLNVMISKAARKAGIGYVDVTKAFAGHRLCETTSRDVAVNGLTAGNDWPATTRGPVGNESYHPNALGQSLLAYSIQEQTATLSKNMPDADPSASPPAESGSVDLLHAPQAPTNRAVFKQVYLPDLAQEVILKGQPAQLKTSSQDIALKPNTIYRVQLRGQQTYELGPAATDSKGVLNAAVLIPNTVSPGQYTLSVAGPNSIGESVNLYMQTFIGGTSTDLDGDGIVDSNDPCVGTAASGIDSDQDGVDDSCDDLIDADPLPGNLYRIRNGDLSKGERASFIYVERNVDLANSAFHIQDFDPDNDGWSLVAKSNTEGTGGQIAHFWLSENQAKLLTDPARYTLRIAARSSTKGCVLLDPENVGVVKKNQPRSLTLFQANTASCGSASPGQQTDNSAMSLYRLRTSQTESGTTGWAYLERNIGAAERLLGISDYSKQNDGWAVVGSQKIAEQKVRGLGVVNRDNNQLIASYALGLGASQVSATLPMDDQIPAQALEPVILVQQKNNLCRAVAPLKLGLVTKDQRRPLVKERELCNMPCPTP